MKQIIVLFASICLVFASSFNSLADTIKIIVKEEKTTCYNKQETSCYWVKFNNNKDWSTLAATIEGFEYEEGYRYKLLVDRTKPKGTTNIDDFSYKLISVVSKEIVASPPHESFEAIKNIKWHLTYFNEQDISNQAMSMTLNADRNRIYLDGGCNNYFGAFTINSRTLNIGMIAGTRKACDQKMELENNYIAAFANQHLRYELTDVYLLIFKNNKHVMTFAKQLENKEYDYLAKYDWKLYKYDTTLMTIRFLNSFISFNKAEHTINGFDGCNSFGGNVEIIKNTIKFNNIISTMRGCIDEVVNDISNNYARMFNTENLTFELIDNRLYINSGEKTLMIFERREKKQP